MRRLAACHGLLVLAARSLDYCPGLLDGDRCRRWDTAGLTRAGRVRTTAMPGLGGAGLRKVCGAPSLSDPSI